MTDPVFLTGGRYCASDLTGHQLNHATVRVRMVTRRMSARSPPIKSGARLWAVTTRMYAANVHPVSPEPANSRAVTVGHYEATIAELTARLAELRAQLADAHEGMLQMIVTWQDTYETLRKVTARAEAEKYLSK